jgi:hypothetical protein
MKTEEDNAVVHLEMTREITKEVDFANATAQPAKKKVSHG